MDTAVNGTQDRSQNGVPQLLNVASRHSVVETLARTLYWAQTSRRLRRMPLAARVMLLTNLLEKRVRRNGRKKVERQIVDFYFRSQLLPESTEIDVDTAANTDASRYSVSWPTVRRMLVRRTINAWGYDVSEVSPDVLAAAELSEDSQCESIRFSDCRGSTSTSSDSEQLDDDIIFLMMFRPVLSSRNADDLPSDVRRRSDENPDEIWNEDQIKEEPELSISDQLTQIRLTSTPDVSDDVNQSAVVEVTNGNQSSNNTEDTDEQTRHLGEKSLEQVREEIEDSDENLINNDSSNIGPTKEDTPQLMLPTDTKTDHDLEKVKSSEKVQSSDTFDAELKAQEDDLTEDCDYEDYNVDDDYYYYYYQYDNDDYYFHYDDDDECDNTAVESSQNDIFRPDGLENSGTSSAIASSLNLLDGSPPERTASVASFDEESHDLLSKHHRDVAVNSDNPKKPKPTEEASVKYCEDSDAKTRVTDDTANGMTEPSLDSTLKNGIHNDVQNTSQKQKANQVNEEDADVENTATDEQRKIVDEESRVTKSDTCNKSLLSTGTSILKDRDNHPRITDIPSHKQCSEQSTHVEKNCEQRADFEDLSDTIVTPENRDVIEKNDVLAKQMPDDGMSTATGPCQSTQVGRHDTIEIDHCSQDVVKIDLSTPFAGQIEENAKKCGDESSFKWNLSLSFEPQSITSPIWVRLEDCSDGACLLTSLQSHCEEKSQTQEDSGVDISAATDDVSRAVVLQTAQRAIHRTVSGLSQWVVVLQRLPELEELFPGRREEDGGSKTECEMDTNLDEYRTRSCAISRRYLKHSKPRRHRYFDRSSGIPQSEWNPPVTLSKAASRAQLDVQHALFTADAPLSNQTSSVGRNKSRKRTPTYWQNAAVASCPKIKKQRVNLMIYTCPLCPFQDNDRAFVMHHTRLTHQQQK